MIDLSAGGGKRAGGGSSHCFGRSLEGLGSRFREFGGRPLVVWGRMVVASKLVKVMVTLNSKGVL